MSVMDAMFSGLCKTVASVKRLASSENVENPVQINSRQCDLLAKKACGVIHVLEELRTVLSIKDDTTPRHALEELHRVLKDAESLIRDCCCGEQWLEVAITRGNLTEMFAKLLYDIEWHTSVLCGVPLTTRSDRSDVFDRSACEGKLGIAEYFLLSQAAKQDRVSLHDRLESGTHHETSESDVEQSSRAAKFLKKLVAEMDRSAISSPSRLILWVQGGDLKTVKKIGSGASAEVMEVTWLGQTYALKRFLHGIEWDVLFRKEIAAMVGLEHPHLVRAICCIGDESSIGIVMELMDKSLHELLQERRRYVGASAKTTLFPIPQSVDLMLQIGEGVKYLHSKNLVHRDLKPANILIRFAGPQKGPDSVHRTDSSTSSTPLTAKIADFGVSAIKNASTSHSATFVGTPRYMAPEMFEYAEKDQLKSLPQFRHFKMDAYSFAMVCYEILTGKAPFFNVLNVEFRRVVIGGERPQLPDSVTSTRLGMLLQRCWHKDSRKRPDFCTICTELRYIKGLLLQGKSVAVDLKPEIKVQGPWGGEGGGDFSDKIFFSDGVSTSIKQIKLKFDTIPSPYICYIETTYDVDGKLFTSGHGSDKHGAYKCKIEINEPNEYLTQIEGSFGDVPFLVDNNRVWGMTSLTIHTTERTLGPFGIESEKKFKSEAGRIVGFHGKCGLVIDKIGCFTAPVLPSLYTTT